MKTKTWLMIWIASFLIMNQLRAQDNSYKIIVHSSNPITSISKKEIMDIFLKKATSWKGGQKVNPVDLTLDSPVRMQFTKAIFGKSTEVIGAYWNHKYYAGLDTPPPMEKSDVDILNYVNNNKNAIGYISESTPLGNYNVKVLKVTE